MKKLIPKHQLGINPWTRIPTEIIEKILEEKKAKEGFDYVPRGPLKPVEGEGGSGKEYDPVRLPNIVIRPSRLTLPLQLPFSPDFIVRPSSPVLTAKKGSRLISKHQSGGWAHLLGREGAIPLKAFKRYGSEDNPVQLPEVVIIGQAPEKKITRGYEYDIQPRIYQGIPIVREGTQEYIMYGDYRQRPDAPEWISYRDIIQMPFRTPDTLYYTGNSLDPPRKITKQQQKQAKAQFMKDAKKGKGVDAKAEAARKRGIKGK